MGFFGTYVWDGNGRLVPSAGSSPYLRVDIHDSDIATIDYQPAGSGSGRCYLGYEPREYFEDPTASAPVDADAEAEGLADWARAVVGVDVTAADFRSMLATPGEAPEDDFVENTVRRLLRNADSPTSRRSRRVGGRAWAGETGQVEARHPATVRCRSDG